MLTNETVKIVEALAPIDAVSAGHTANHVSMKGYQHLTIIINAGAWAGGTSAVTLQQATVVAGTDDKALGFSWMWTNIAAVTTDTLVKTAVTANTFNVGTANGMWIIEIDAEMLDADNDFDCVELNFATPGANADLLQATYILSGARYADQVSALLD